jgi:hypothetical protein
VYVARNPKDVIVSFYHHHKLMKMQGCDGNLENFADYFMKDQGAITLMASNNNSVVAYFSSF